MSVRAGPNECSDYPRREAAVILCKGVVDRSAFAPNCLESSFRLSKSRIGCEAGTLQPV